MREELSRQQIFEMIAKKKITAEEGYKLIKQFHSKNNNLLNQDINSLQLNKSSQEIPLNKKIEINSDYQIKLHKDLIDITAEILKISPNEIDEESDMQDFGFDSITLTSLVDKINKNYELDLMPTIFYELQPPTLNSFTNYLLSSYQTHIYHFYEQNINGMQNSKVTEGDYEESQRKIKFRIKEESDPLPVTSREPIAIIGISGIMPKSKDLDKFWRHLELGEDLITEVPTGRWDCQNFPEACKGGFIENVDKFDAEFFNISPREAKLMDPQQRLFLETSWKAIEDAGYKPSSLSGTKTGVFVGVSTSDYLDILTANMIESEPHISTGIAHSILANRISYLLNLKGPSEAVDTACSSSLVAIKRAVDALQNNTCEMALAGGVHINLSGKWFKVLHAAGMLSPGGRCKTFDKNADGYVRGEGVGVILLKRLSRAKADGDHIYALILGCAENHGGRAQTLTSPNTNAQAALLIDAYQNSNVMPNTIGYIETHGTATKLGDPIEINGLKQAFQELYRLNNLTLPQAPHCGIGSVKTNIGHLEAAAGIAGILKVVLALKYKKIPASINCTHLNPYIKLQDSPFYIIKETISWDSIMDTNNKILPRRAGISSFGFGGTNIHVILEEWPFSFSEASISKKHKVIEPQLIVLSAKNLERLKEYAKITAEYLKNTKHSLSDLAYTLHIGRDSMEERLAIIASDIDELIRKLKDYCQDLHNPGEQVYHGNIDSNRKDNASKIKELLSKEKISNMIKNKNLDKLAQLYINGVDIEWSNLYNNLKYHRISLPTYPFEKKRYWVESPTTQKIKSSLPSQNFNVSSNKEKQNLKLRLKPLTENETIKEETFTRNQEKNQITLKLPSTSFENEDHQNLNELTHNINKMAKKTNSFPIKINGEINENLSFNSGEKMENIQEQVKNILAKVLFIEPSKVNENKPFVELGLDSILAVEFSRNLNKVFGIDIKTTKLYDHSTIFKLTEYINNIGILDKDEIKISMSKSNSIPLIMKESIQESKVTGILKEILAKILFMESTKISEGKAFMEMGLDSILAVEFTKKINEVFHVEIKTTKLYEYSTIHKLKDFIISNQMENNVAKIQSIYNEKPYKDFEREKELIFSKEPENTNAGSSAHISSGDIAIIGMSARFPGAENVSQYWENLKNGVDSVTEIPAERWRIDQFYDPAGSNPGKTTSKWGGFLSDIDKFDPLFFNISPAEAELMDPQQRIFLQEAWRAIEDAGYSADSFCNVRCGVYVGVMSGIEYPSESMLNAHSILASRISYFLNLKGPALSIDTACSSSLVALHLACKNLLEGETDIMLVGGVTLYLTEKAYIGMSRMGDILSRSGKCRTFDNDADGFVPAEGVGVVVLKPLKKAISEGDNIYGVIKGSGINQDGRTNGITAPSAESQKELELDVYKKYNIDPGTITYVETHGTGTKLGDPIEVEALTEAFRQYTQKKQYCPIGSVKTNIGHTSAAAGIASVIKVLLSMKYNKIPPSLHFYKANEHIDFQQTPFYVNTQLKEWKTNSTNLKKAAISSFGYSGTNAHIVIEESPNINNKNNNQLNEWPFYFIPLSARSKEILDKKILDLVNWLNNEANLQKYSIDEISYTLGIGRTHFPFRTAMIIKDIDDFKQTLNKIAQGESPENYFKNKININNQMDNNILKKSVIPLIDKLKAYNKLSDIDYKQTLLKIIELYLKGYTPDIDHSYLVNNSKRIPLPTYPFVKERYWINPDISPQLYELPSEIEHLGKSSTYNLEKHVIDENYITDKINKNLIKRLKEILKVCEKDIDFNGNFLEYGFDSITFTEYIKKINNDYNINLEIESVFELKNPTISSLSNYLYHEFKDSFYKYFQKEIDTKTLPTKRMPFYESLKSSVQHQTSESIAIIGISGILPKSENLKIFWENLEEGIQFSSSVPIERWKTNLFSLETLKEKKGNFLNNIDTFDADFFGISTDEVLFIDPQQRFFLEETWKAIEDAGYIPSTLSESVTGVFVGVNASGYEEVIKTTLQPDEIDNWQIQALNSPTLVAHRISNYFNFTGPSETFAPEVFGSLAAINRAVEALRFGLCSIAIAGGVHMILDPTKINGNKNHKDETLLAEGVGVVVLKPMSKAIAEGDHIYAVIKESRANHSGKRLPFLKKSVSNDIDKINIGIGKIQAPIETINYLDVQSTLIDEKNVKAKEIDFLESLFPTKNNEKYCAIGSIKEDIGNLEGVLGISALFKILLAMKCKRFPVSKNNKNINKWDQKNNPFYLINEIRVWEYKVDDNNQKIPRRAGISALGYNGAVINLILDEYVETNSSFTMSSNETETQQIIILSAKNPQCLKIYAKQLRDFLQDTIKNKPAEAKPISNSHVNKHNWRHKCEEDILTISGETLKVGSQGYQISSIKEFINRLNKLFTFNLTEDLFNTQPSLGALIKYIKRNYKKELETFYLNQNSDISKTRSFSKCKIKLDDIAYTLQIGRKAMVNRLAIVVSSLEELIEKLDSYCSDKKSIDNLFIGNINKPQGQAILLMEGEEKNEFIKSLIKNKKYVKLGYCWVLGVEIDWEILHSKSKPRRVSLPTYPFQKKSYWIGSPAIKVNSKKNTTKRRSNNETIKLRKSKTK